TCPSRATRSTPDPILASPRRAARSPACWRKGRTIMAAHMLPRSTPTELRPGSDGLIRGLQPPRRGGVRLSEHPNLIRATTVGAFLVAWELYGRSLNPIFLSYPVAIVGAAADLIGSGELVAALLKSLQGLAIGFSLAVVVGIGLGLLMGR